MYTQVVVLTYQSPDIDSYTYKVPKGLEKEIKVGQLVEVPFGERSPMGIVLSIVDRPSTIVEKIKSINSITIQTPLLLPFQIELLKWMSFYYMAPMVNCLEAMLPNLPNVKKLTTNAKTEKSFSHSTLVLSQTLVLVPSINRIPETLAKFKMAKNYITYHNELKTPERFNTWMEILSGQIDHVFGSRSAIFAPCPKFAKIIIFDEHDGAYKDERSPYFDTLTVAEKIKELAKCQLEIVDNSPKITTYFNHHSNIKSEKIRTKTKIVSMQDERASGNKSPISNILGKYLIYAAKNNKKVLFFLNIKKESGHLFCRSCKVSAFVPKIPKVCPNCQSPDFYFSSLNIYSLKDEVKKNLPKYENIDIETTAALYKPTLYKYDLIAHIFVDSLIGTPDFATDEKAFCQINDLKSLLAPTGLLLIQTYNPNNPTLNLIIQNDYQKFYKNQIDLRRKLHYPPFALLVKLILKGKSEEKLLIESNKLVQALNRSIVNGQMSSIRQAQDDPELTEGLSIRQAQDDPKLTEGSSVSILGPYKPVFFAKNPTYNIIIKRRLNGYSLRSRQSAIQNLEKIIDSVSRKWQITVEPDTIN